MDCAISGGDKSPINKRIQVQAISGSALFNYMHFIFSSSKQCYEVHTCVTPFY